MIPGAPEGAVALLAGGVAGFGVTLLALRARSRLRVAAAYAAGVLFGATAGLLLYAVGYVLTTGGWPLPLEPVELGTELGEALSSLTLVQAFCTLLGAALGFLTARYSWRLEGLVAYVALVAVVAGYVIYAVTVTVPRVPLDHLPVSLLLLAAEGFSLGMVVVYAFYGLDIFMKRRWRRSADKVPFSRYYLPRVAFHVTVFNEPSGMVERTLEALERLDYPQDRVVIMVLDDSTDSTIRSRLQAVCGARGHAYLHRADRRGFKAGALNAALTKTPADVDLIAVVDADYQVEPEYLKETVGYFINPNLAFIQTPQDYRNTHQSFLTRQYYYADGYFYRAVLPSRNEENTIIFCGTMGLIRKRVLEGVGGWGERFITEDQELSVRVLERGYDSFYVNKTFGKGVMPSTFDAYKKQHYRWSFGSVKILKAHFHKLFFSRLTLRQKLDFFVGNLHWFDGAFIITISGVLALVALSDALGLGFVTHHQREIWLIGLVPFFLLLDGIVRLHVGLRRSMHLSLGGTLRVIGMWMAIKFNNLGAATKSLLGFAAPFVRTPKAPEGRPTRKQCLKLALRLCRFESAMALFLCATSILAAAGAWGAVGRAAPADEVAAHALLAFWLAFYGLVFTCAPLYAYKSYATFVPEQELYPAPGVPAVAEARG